MSSQAIALSANSFSSYETSNQSLRLEKSKDQVNLEKIIAKVEAQIQKNPRSRTKPTKNEIIYFKKILEENRNDFLDSLDIHTDAIRNHSHNNIAGDVAKHGTNENKKQEAALFANRDNHIIKGITNALSRMENGLYGICFDCIEEKFQLTKNNLSINDIKHKIGKGFFIEKARLKALPATKRCIAHSKK